MRRILPLLFFILILKVYAQVSPAEKAALKTLYDMTGGSNWTSETDADPTNDWDFSGPVNEDWYGIFMTDGRLEVLRLYNNNLEGTIPAEIGDLKELRALYLGSNKLSGTLPESLGKLKNLKTLYASGNELSGPIPLSLGELTELQQIQIEYNNLQGTIPENLGKSPNLTLLYLGDNELNGPIPESLGDYIVELILSNNQLTGAIPSSFSRPGRPWFALRVDNNRLNGMIPDYYTPGNYDDLSFANNRFEFGGFEQNFVDYKDNYYRFSYSPQAKLNESETLDLLEGSATTMVTYCTGTQNNYQWFKNGIALYDDGTISGSQTGTLKINDLKATDQGVYHCEVTSDIVIGMTLERNPITLNLLPTASCEITDREALMALYNATDGPNWANNTNWGSAEPLNSWFGVSTNGDGCVTILDLDVDQAIDETRGNGLRGALPPEIGNLRALSILDLSNQQLSGFIPASLGNATQLYFLDLGENNLSGTIPSSFGALTKMEDLLLHHNHLTGPIPTEIANMARLETFLAHDNRLSGEIPDDLGNLSRLRAIWLHENKLKGEIPATLGELPNITQITLSDNVLTGAIPEQLGNLAKLEILWLSKNQLSGKIPESFGQLEKLEQLLLWSNQLVGPIPKSFGNLKSLINLVVGDNPLTGTIPSELENLSQLETLYIYQTGISGVIPAGLGRLTKLRELWLAFNDLEGEIPDSFKNLADLTQLVLQDNRLSGEIPEEIGALPLLKDVAFSNNQLQGEIPYFTSPSLDILVFENNLFQFGDFERNFEAYSQNLSLFLDNPQAKIDRIEILDTLIGDNITLTTTASGSQNHYQWFKDGQVLHEAPDSPQLILTNINPKDAWVYHCEVTSTIITDLTLVRNDITLNVGCSVPKVVELQDVVVCESYTLPTLSQDNAYFTEPSGKGLQLYPGDIITNSRTIYVLAMSGTCSNERSFTVSIDSNRCGEQILTVECVPEFPNFFTPNGDGRNDFFKVTGNPCVPQGTLTIYDRYGSLLFQGNLDGSQWDGTHSGRLMPETDYWYQGVDSVSGQVYIGHFSLIR